MAKVLRSIFLEPDLDMQLATQADREQTTKSELIRRYCVEGLERAEYRSLEKDPEAFPEIDVLPEIEIKEPSIEFLDSPPLRKKRPFAIADGVLAAPSANVVVNKNKPAKAAALTKTVGKSITSRGNKP